MKKINPWILVMCIVLNFLLSSCGSAGGGANSSFSGLNDTITMFGLSEPTVASLQSASTMEVVDGVIYGAQNIAVKVPYGTNVTNLVSTFITSGVTVAVHGTPQVSGVTQNDFTNPVVYTVTAADGSTLSYTVAVTVASVTEKSITEFSLNGSNGVINGTNIAVTVPFGTNPTNLVATYTMSGASVAVGGNAQTSGVTPNDFTSPVVYTVTAADGSTQNYTVTVTVASNTAYSITAYTLAGSSGVIAGNNIAVTVPFGTNLTALVATFTTSGASVTVGGNAQTSGATPNNFSSPVVYTVTAANGSTQTYTVTVTVASNTAYSITTYELNGSNGVIAGNNIAVTVPFGTNLTALIATYTTSGASVKVGGVAQVSTVTPNDFSSPVVYTVTAADGSTQTYTVTVTVAASSAKSITAYTLDGVTGVINGTDISVTVPFGTNLTALIATYTTSGASVAVGGTTQTSGATPNDFTSPVVYTVTAADGSTQNYTVTVTVAANTAKSITSYTLAGSNGVIAGNNIAVTVPFGTNLTALIATYTTSGASVTVGGTAQTSGATPNNFSSPVVYTVTAADGSTQTYTVTVTVASNTAKAITLYELAGVTGVINGTDISVTIPSGTSPNGLIATYNTSGASVAVGVTPQVSGVTPNNFTSPVVYTVTAADGSTQTYTVTVTIAPSSAKSITAYYLNGSSGVINGLNIAVTVPAGTSPNGLIATFTTSGASVAVGATPQVSGVTPNNFSSPVVYTVTAADGSTQNYTVTVTVATNSAKSITAYYLNGSSGVITGNNISVTVPFGTSPNGLIATFTTSGASVTVGGTAQVSTVTPNDFTSPVVYTVTAADGSTQTYTVTVTVAANTAKAITLYELAGANGVINGLNINVTVPFGTNLTALIATYTTSGASVAVGGTTQTSGATPNDFTSPVVYTVTAADGSTQNYTVTVTVATNSAKSITAYYLNGSSGVIAGNNISVTVPFGTSPAALIATFTTTGASVTVGGTAQVSTVTPNNFSSPVVYTVTAADGSTQNYTVTVTVAANTAKSITSYTLAGANGVITGNNIAVTVPSGTDISSNLIAVFTNSPGSSVTVGATPQVSGVTSNNFSSPVVYTVTAADGSTQTYTVTVTQSPI